MSAFSRPTCILRIFSQFRKCSRFFHHGTQRTILIPTHKYFRRVICFDKSIVLCMCSQHAQRSDFGHDAKYSTVTSDSTEQTKTDSGQSGESKEQGPFITFMKKWGTTIAFVCLTGSVFSIVHSFGAAPTDFNGNQIEDEFSKGESMILRIYTTGALRRLQNKLPYNINNGTITAYYLRAKSNILDWMQGIAEPSRQILLPEPLQYPYIQPPYTLVMEMRGVLVKPEWTYSTGWRFKKRPGVEYFLQNIGPPLFETVIYTGETGTTAMPVLFNLDNQGHIMYKLYRDATRYERKGVRGGVHVKDLSYLNRDLSKVIMIDCNADSVKYQRRNAFIVKDWDGDPRDTTLFDLTTLLQTIAHSKVDDVRSVLEYYMQFDDPVAKYRENQLILQEEQERQKKLMMEKQQKQQSGGFPSMIRKK